MTGAWEKVFTMQDQINKDNKFVKEVVDQKYEYGFTTDVQTEIIPKGLSEDVVRLISKRRESPTGSSTSA